MNKKLILGFLSACLVAGFWACGTGDIETVGSGDENALGLYGFDPDAMDGLVSKAKQDCKDDPDCVAAQEGATAIGDEDDDDDPSDVDEESSDSEGESSDSEESSSATIESSSATGTSSATPNSSATVASSSGTATSSAAVGSSSSTGLSSSSAKSSSSIQSSSSAGPGPAKGTCKATAVTITKGGSVTWKAYRVGGTFVTYDWTFSDGSGIASSKDSVPSVKYDKPGTYTATLVINKGTDTTSAEIKCGNVIVTGTKIEGCTCTNPDSSTTLFYKSGSPASSTWKVSGCKNADGSAADFTYSWSGAVSGTSASATASLSSASTFSAQVTVKNGDGSTATPTCPSVVTAAQMTATCAFKGNNTSSNASLPGKSMYFSASSFQNWPATLSSPASMVLKGNGEDKTYSVNKGSSINQMITAPSKPGIYTYSFEVNESQVCTADLVVNQLKASCPTIEGEIGKSVNNISITPSGLTNQSFTRYIKLQKNDSTLTSKTCYSGNCQSMSFTMLKPSGTYKYDLYADAEKLCSGTLKANNPKPTASCSFATTPSYPGMSVQFKVSSIQNWGYMENQQTMTLEGNGSSREISINKSSPSFYETVPSKAGSYDYYLRFEGNQFCKASVTVNELTASCPTIEEVRGKQVSNLSMKPSGLTSQQITRYIKLKGNDSTLTSKTCNSGNCQSMSFYMLKTEGNYNYELYADTLKLCEGVLISKDPLTCSVDKTEIGLGDNFTFYTTYASGCSAANTKQDGTTYSSGCKGSQTITPSSTGTHTYIYSVTSGTYSASACTTSVVVKDVAPTCAVPSMIMPTEDAFKITPSSSIGCLGESCSYTVTGGTTGGADGSGFTTGGTITGPAGESAAGTAAYTLKLTNSIGSGSCNFDVTFMEPVSVSMTSSSSSVTFEPGNLYKVSYDGSHGTLLCPTGLGYTVTCNGTDYAGQQYSQLQLSPSKCGVVMVTGKSISCNYTW